MYENNVNIIAYPYAYNAQVSNTVNIISMAITKDKIVLDTKYTWFV